MHSVTSNAVYSAFNTVTHYSGTYCNLYKIGKFVFLSIYFQGGGASPITLERVPYKPITSVRSALINNVDDGHAGQIILDSRGDLKIWRVGGGTFVSGTWVGSFFYITQ